jgi:hypothetical protein
MIDLLSIQPHKVSRDLSGYITYIYGAAGVGKTTLCAQFPSALILAFEKGYNALPGVMVQDITTWGEFKQVLRELKKPEVHEKFKTIVIDTVDVAGSLCEKYICNQLGIENIGDGGWSTNGWTKYKKEFEESFRTITQLGYALVCISHDKDKTFKRKDGTEYNQIIPTAQSSINEIVKNMVDLYAYAMQDLNGARKLVFRSSDGSIDAKSRFRYMPAEVGLSYDALVEALNTAIDKEANEHNNEFVTTERAAEVIAPVYDYDALMTEFQQLTGELMQKDSSGYGPKIKEIVDRYLGKGKKVSETTRDQAEFIDLIIGEIKSTLL